MLEIRLVVRPRRQQHDFRILSMLRREAGQHLALDAKERRQPLHLAVAQSRSAGAVLHTHSVWSTVLSELYGAERGLRLTGFEMLKGLEGVRTHEHSEWVPILENDQDIPALAGRVETMLDEWPAVHGFLLRGHGLYTWGDDLPRARRHVVILEFLLETTGRMQTLTGGGHGPGKNS